MDKNQGNSGKRGLFLADLLRGIGIGVAFIIPGFSGGSVAAILGIYERLVGAIASIFKSFKSSITTVLPIGIGMVVGAISLLFPLKWTLGTVPFPTVSLFVGLTLGCLPSLYENIRGRITVSNAVAFALPMVLTLLLSFAPIGSEVDLSSPGPLGYLLLLLVGIVGSSALVIPGISGSMLLLMLGYYNPIVVMITDLIKGVLRGSFAGGLTSVAVLATLALGICIGFIGISVIMKKLFEVCKRGTYFAIIGFIIGSLPTVYSSTYKDGGFTPETLPASPLHWIGCAAMLALGIAIAYGFFLLAKRKNARNK